MRIISLAQRLLAWVQSLFLGNWQLQAVPVKKGDRGDVPGWVMITMMTAILVAALLVVAQDALITMFNNAMAKIGQ